MITEKIIAKKIWISCLDLMLKNQTKMEKTAIH